MKEPWAVLLAMLITGTVGTFIWSKAPDDVRMGFKYAGVFFLVVAIFVLIMMLFVYGFRGQLG